MQEQCIPAINNYVIMKQLYLCLSLVTAAFCTKAQPVYNATDYASSGDTVYLTSVLPGAYNFDTTGAGITWNYAAFTGVSQRQLTFRPPSQTGFTPTQWPYIYNSSNVNLSSTDNQTYALGNFQVTDPNDYFLKNNSVLQQKASSFAIVVNNTQINIKNVYTTPDVIYQFPLNYNDVDSSTASFTTSIPGLYYRETSIKRVNTINGWGTVITPSGTFSNCLKVVSDLMQIDTVSIDTIGFPKDTTYFREYSWLDYSTSYPVLYVKQVRTGMIYITQEIEYYDMQQFFQPNALFAYLPVAPYAGDTVLFQNLSSNSTSFRWNFDDPSSGADDSSALQNPEHIFNAPGTYNVRLIANNGTLSDTITLPVYVSVITGTAPAAQETTTGLALFPNPAGDCVFLTGSETLNAAVRLYDVTGKQYHTTVTGSRIDLSAVPPGCYLLLVQQGNEVKTSRIIRQ